MPSSDIKPQVTLSPDLRRVVSGVDLADLHLTVDIGLVDRVDAAAAAVVASGSELTVDPAAAPQGLVDDSDAFLPGRVFDQNRFHALRSFHTWFSA